MHFNDDKFNKVLVLFSSDKFEFFKKFLFASRAEC